MFIGFLKGEDMFGGEMIAVDGSKFKAQNNKKNTFNDPKLIKSLAYIEAKTEEYIKELDDCDALEDKQAAELKKKEVLKKVEQLADRKEKQVTTIVAYPERNNKNIDPAYQTDKFVYNEQQDNYICPAGAILITNGSTYEKKNKGRVSYFVKKYETSSCSTCPFKGLCTRGKNRIIE